jgi:lysylphosphatidylglycerol synthetase-like protein (DUF2156 family)
MRVMVQLRPWWLPTYLLLSLSWLFGPGLNQQQLGNLSPISLYETSGQPYAWLFRLCDIAAAVVLVLATRAFVAKRSKIFSRILYLCAALAGIDGIFTFDGSSSIWQTFSTFIHTHETILAVLLLVGFSVYDLVKQKTVYTQLFVAFEFFCLTGIIINLDNTAALSVLQFIFQIASVTWIAWVVHRFDSPARLSQRAQIYWRRFFAVLTAATGILLILVATFHAAQRAPALLEIIGREYALAAQHGVIIGVIMLYLARHLAQGQRRAAILLSLIFLSQIIVYSVLNPAVGLLGLSLLSYCLLWYGAAAFDRNVGPLKIAGRAADAAIVLSGVVLALGLLVLVVGFTGTSSRLEHVFNRAYNLETVSDARENLQSRGRSIERSAERLRQVGDTLFVVTIFMLLWSLFRPTFTKSAEPTSDDIARVKEIMDAHSLSSEDYFKLWPADKRYFFNKGRTGFIAYKITGRVAFALADPVAPGRQRRPLVKAFMEFCQAQGLSACFLLVSGPSRKLYEDLGVVKIGASAVVGIEQFVTQTARDKWWRWQRNRSTKRGDSYELHQPPHSHQLLAETFQLSTHWLQRSGHSEQSFALGYYDADHLQQCRLHILRDKDSRMIAFANQLPTFNNNPQATVDLIRFEPNADGAMPAVIMHILETLYTEGSFTRFDLGFVPLAGVENPVVTLARRLAAGRFSAAGLEQFKSKFNPEWEENFIAYDGDYIDLAAILRNLDKAMDAPDMKGTSEPSDLRTWAS